MYYRLNENGSVLDWCDIKYLDDCLFTEKDIIVAWNGAFYISGDEPEEPVELKHARVKKQLTSLIQRILDKKAREYDYDSCLSACSYQDTGVPEFDAEGRAFRAWRSQVWKIGYEILNDVVAGKREMPSIDELSNELPQLMIEKVE